MSFFLVAQGRDDFTDLEESFDLVGCGGDVGTRRDRVFKRAR
jgi:hypothetical protein